MEQLSRGEVIFVPFPFSDLSAHKLRPALVLATAMHGDYLLCQITSNPYADPNALMIESMHFQDGGLDRPSYARPTKLFTASSNIVASRVGTMSQEWMAHCIDTIVDWLRSTH